MSNSKSLLNRIRKIPELSIIISFLVLLIFFSFATDNFFSQQNLMGVLRQSVVQMSVAVGMTFILISDGIDLSVGSVACLSGTIMAGLMSKNGWNPVAAILVGLLLGTALGAVNGAVIAIVKIPAFIVTLGMMSSARGLSLVYCGSLPINDLPDSVMMLGRESIAGIPMLAIFTFVLVIIAAFVLTKTNFGRKVYAIGGNEECARLSGVKVRNVKISVFAISGFCSAVAGLFLLMRLFSSQPTMGEGLEMDAISAAVLGGTSISGGKGTILGTVLGCLFLSFLTNGFNVFGVSSFWQQVFKGVVLVLAASLYERRKR